MIRGWFFCRFVLKSTSEFIKKIIKKCKGSSVKCKYEAGKQEIGNFVNINACQ